eukprot:4075635-Amphidinium_carterae.1
MFQPVNTDLGCFIKGQNQSKQGSCVLVRAILPPGTCHMHDCTKEVAGNSKVEMEPVYSEHPACKARQTPDWDHCAKPLQAQ